MSATTTPLLSPDPRPSDRRDLQIKIGGAAGLGIKAAGQTLARAFVRGGLHTFDLTEYPSLIRGGHNVYQVRVSPDPVLCHVRAVDILVALNRETADIHLSELVEGGAFVYDPDDLDPADLLQGRDVCAVPVPFTRVAKDAGGTRIMANVAALGAVLALCGYPLEHLEASLRAQFASKTPDIAEKNVAVARAGHAAGAATGCSFPFSLSPVPDAPGRILADGNEAIGLGALAAGMSFYAAYPMTPASSLLHFMAAHERDLGVVVKHSEDEIAAINMVIGAAFGGARAMCATSGGGFSLMVEALGLAGVSESAIVVGVFSRPGPATGMPTWTEQSDLRFVIHAAQGEFPRVVLAPGDVEEAFELSWRAFDLADRLQTPVILLGDSYLSDNRRSTAPFAADEVTVDRGKLVAEGSITEHPDALGDDGTYRRYLLTDDGVSVRALPGVRGACQVVNSYEHDEYGYGAAGEVAAVRVAQNTKRLSKLELARRIVPPPKRHGVAPEDADVSVLLFGTTKQPVLQAVEWLSASGVAVSVLQLVTLQPFPAEEVSAFLGGSRHTAVIEGNLTGQLEGLVREHCLLGLDDRLRRADGRPFPPEDVTAFLRSVSGKEASHARA